MEKFLSCISNETRLKIIKCLYVFQRKNVSELLASCDLSQSALSQHLKILKECGIVSSEKKGKYNIYTLTDRKIVTLVNLLFQESHKYNK